MTRVLATTEFAPKNKREEGMVTLDGRVALITGASRGTGAAIARRFVAEGARVVIADILDEPGEQLAKELGEAAHYVHLDVSDEAGWQRAIAFTLEHFAAIDILVNNAAILLLKALVDTEAEEFDRVVAVNQKGTFLGIKSVAQAMKDAGRGSIVNISSIDGRSAKNGIIAYAGTKWAIRGMTRVAALELGRFGIRVNAVCPEAGSADMMSPYIPDGIDIEKIAARQQPFLSTQKDRSIADRLGDIANLVVFLASDASASCTGCDYPVDGGNLAGKMIPGTPGA